MRTNQQPVYMSNRTILTSPFYPFILIHFSLMQFFLWQRCKGNFEKSQRQAGYALGIVLVSVFARTQAYMCSTNVRVLDYPRRFWELHKEEHRSTQKRRYMPYKRTNLIHLVTVSISKITLPIATHATMQHLAPPTLPST